MPRHSTRPKNTNFQKKSRCYNILPYLCPVTLTGIFQNGTASPAVTCRSFDLESGTVGTLHAVTQVLLDFAGEKTCRYIKSASGSSDQPST